MAGTDPEAVNYEHKTGTKLATRVMPRWLQQLWNLPHLRKFLRSLNGLCEKVMDFLTPNHYVCVSHTGVYVMPRGPRGDMRPDRDIGRAALVLRPKSLLKKADNGERGLIAETATAARWRS
jgi:hypothetical protein